MRVTSLFHSEVFTDSVVNNDQYSESGNKLLCKIGK